jgi:hypothetical protein
MCVLINPRQQKNLHPSSLKARPGPLQPAQDGNFEVYALSESAVVVLEARSTGPALGH